MFRAFLRIWILSLCLFPWELSAQFTDNFSDGNFSANPVWSGTTGLFTINGAGQLQTNGPAQADTAWLSTHFSPDFNDTIIWQLYWKMNFSASDNNNSRIYLTSDNDVLGSGQNGAYYLQIGNSGNDYLKFFKQIGAISTQLAIGTTDLSTNPAVAIKTIRFPNGNWQIFLDPAGGANFTLELSFTDTQITSSSRFGVWCKYTQTNYNKFFFDDFAVNGTAYVDIAPPQLAFAIPNSSSELLVTFNEPVGVSGINPLNYSVNHGIGSPANATFQNSEQTQVLLQFGNSFPIADTLNLYAFNIADTLGNSSIADTIAFIYYDFVIPGQRDVVINELMADPSPPIGLPELEYVELLNTTADYVLLSGMTITDGTSTGIIGNGATIYLEPNEYALLCSINSIQSFTGYGKVIGLTPFPTLNNTGDDIRLYSVSNQIIDRVNYTESWYGDASKKDGGFSLEQINPFNPCSGKQNWTASNSPDGGTPGTENSVFSNEPDTVSPMIREVLIDSTNQITAVFDESMDSISLVTAAFSLNKGITINSKEISTFDHSRVTLRLQSALDSAEVYRLTLSGAQDCFGNQSGSINIDFGIGAKPRSFDLIFNEVYPDPDTASEIPAVEFIEIFNRSHRLISTAGLLLHDRSSSAHLYTDVIFPGEYIIICDDGNSDLFEPYSRVIQVSSMPSLNNSDERLSLSINNALIDRLSYDATWYRDETKSNGGYTLERINPSNLCGGYDNWMASIDPTGGTPGRSNSILDSAGEVPSLGLIGAQFSKMNEVTLTFNQRLDSTSAFNAIYTDNGTEMKALNLSETQSEVQIRANSDFKRGTMHQLKIGSVENCLNQVSNNLRTGVYLPDSADIIINEVLFNPRGSGSDFVEVYNRSEYIINLQGWKLGYLDSKDSLQFNVIAEKPLNINPGMFIAFNEDSNNIKANYFTARNLFETNLPSYANTSGSVRVFDLFDFEMDRLNYTEDMQFALIENPDGVSLERLSSDRPAKDLGNWHSASSEYNYGTPGFENSQVYSEVWDSSPFSLSSEFISPDNDGYQDVVNLQYHDLPIGMSATIKIFTDQGFLVRSLCSNLLLGNAGEITWDGIDDNGEKALIGIYAFWVQVFNLSGENYIYRLPLVVASKIN